MRLDVPANRAMLADILTDARDNAGSLSPTVWPVEIETKTLTDMLDGLIGQAGRLPVTARSREYFAPFLGRERIPIEINTDLGTAMDLDLTGPFLPDTPIRVCEVGGGYGRLAEAFLSTRPVHYVLVDSVPAVLMYAYEYLHAIFPDKRIGSVYAGHQYSTNWDCFILPAWRTGDIGPFDLTVNIESMQEMNESQVSYFLEWFDEVTVPDGIVYISNARDHFYKGPWPFPSNWEPLYWHNTPRSWSPDHPTIIFRKGTGDYTARCRKAERLFEREMTEWRIEQASLA